MPRSHAILKRFCCFALLLMLVPATGGATVCTKKARHHGDVGPLPGIVAGGAESSSVMTRTVSGSGPECACKKAKSCPVMPKRFVVSPRASSQVELSFEKNSLRVCGLGNSAADVFASPELSYPHQSNAHGEIARPQPVSTTVLLL